MSLMFQSLLCWIMVCKLGYEIADDATSCFNPCYVGLWSVSLERLGGNGDPGGVSILVMLDYGL